MPDAEQLEAVVREIVASVVRGKEQLFQLGDQAREERARLTAELEALRREAARFAVRLGELEQRARVARARLAAVSGNVGRSTEEDIQRAYLEAEQAQAEVARVQAAATAVVRRCEAVERLVRQMETLATRSEELVNAVGLAMEFLSGRAGSNPGLGRRAVLATQIIHAQEEERRRIAREIHDGPAQAMANIVLRAEICEKTMQTGKGDLGAELAELKRLAKDCLREVRRIIFDLRPMTLDDLGLVPALRRYVEEFRKQVPFAVKFAAYGKERRLEQGVEAALFRFVQEALTNCRKYAKATKAEVRLDFLPGQVRVVVEDDGVGFEPEAVLRAQRNKNDHFGLLGMKERMDLLGGGFEIVSAPGKGTRLVAHISLEEAVGEVVSR